MSSLERALRSHQISGTYRSLRVAGGGVDFSSNDYLGFAKCSRIRANLIRELELGCPLGATGSRLLSGHTIYHERVESFLAKTFGVESALLFSSGFMANMGVMITFASLGAQFFSDELNHASLIDGMRLARANKAIFRHNDLVHLEELLSKSTQPLKVIVTESVFSMDGDLSPLPSLVQLAQSFGAWLIVDEAHATGVWGLGRLEETRTGYSRIVSVHTGGKALGGQGAFVLSNDNVRKLLINRARSFTFSTALSPLSALQIEYAIQEILSRPKMGRNLLNCSEWFRELLGRDIDTFQSRSQIVPVLVGSNERALTVARSLQEQGFDVRPIRSPTVPAGTGRLRISVKAFHSSGDLEELSSALKRVLL